MKTESPCETFSKPDLKVVGGRSVNDKTKWHGEERRDPPPDHSLNVIRTVFALLTAGILSWAGLNIHHATREVSVIISQMADIKTQQTTILTKQNETHDAVLIMSATYASKEDLEKQRDILQKQLRGIEHRLIILEGYHKYD